MLRVPSFPLVSSLGTFLRDSGYDVPHLGDGMGLGDSLHANHDNLESLLARTEDDSALAVLARLFFIGWPVPENRCRAALPADFLKTSLDCALLDQHPEGLSASACIFPFRSRLIACDTLRNRAAQPEMVPGPSASTHFPARLAIGGQNETTLDLGTGTGALALEASRYSQQVVGTDISTRALQYAEFNAALNNVTGLEWRSGDAFAPVAGRKFSRILANPPFFLTPGRTFTYSDSPMELDGFSARLARECSAHLQEGGFFQMICECVELEGEPWESRLREWTAQSRCDVLVLISARLDPVSYAEKLSHEFNLMQGRQHGPPFRDRLNYLLTRRVTSIVSCTVNMRKRSGVPNWFTAIGAELAGSEIGADVSSRFNALTLLAANQPQRVLESKLRLTPGVLLDQVCEPSEQIWHTLTVDLVKPTGILDKLRLDESVARSIPLFDGSKNVQEIAAVVAHHLHIPPEDAQKRCLQLARRLLLSGFVSIEE